MLKLLAVLFTGVIVSFYYFPFEFSFLPGINTKMGLAVVGLALAAFQLTKKRLQGAPKDVFTITVLAIIVSLIGLFSVIFNNTPDYAYATYVVSMCVWLSGAYTTCMLIKKVHHHLTLETLTFYLTAVCVFQCIMALIIDSNIAVKNFVDTYVIQDQELLTELERIYGIGAYLDIAGVRFSACLILLTSAINKNKDKMNNVQMLVALIAYIVIAVVGNMIARTTIVGVGLSVACVMVTFRPNSVSNSFFRLLRVALVVLLVALPLSVYLYNNSLQFHELSRFAFEGFFNLFEKGEWQIDSNDKLKTMIVFPDNAKTWIIGDGYFINPYYSDPTYVGYQPGGYYMGTDIGYLRFIFYFGLIGLLAFSFFFVTSAKVCITKLPEYKLLILFILLLGFVIWLKVATDVFLVFALLLCVANLRDEDNEYLIESKN
jgi:hypothetical protein